MNGPEQGVRAVFFGKGVGSDGRVGAGGEQLGDLCRLVALVEAVLAHHRLHAAHGPSEDRRGLKNAEADTDMDTEIDTEIEM
eukprot:3952227-Pleurochrysis_carterae.AAC.1